MLNALEVQLHKLVINFASLALKTIVASWAKAALIPFARAAKRV